MAINPNTKKTEVTILTDAFVIKGFIYVPANMRFSDALNKFLKDIQFLPVVNAEIRAINSNQIVEKRDFILIKKEMIVVISPSSE
ncbi:hypothetical protein [Caldisericum exile]|uniref:Uncharacterized protein n=1 Tax=Caldisericum exile (strain DSM 21853 / NBRC 104410 / AZM16c01) TaxID=511051 RepID=A0A7U6JGY5_CALEA|nr:hypothetical protein [Caldisericum exile]BAL81022.1 hypothetical protein CSE_08960 [Caldisericum exile AZM16c01]